jgi:multicomponent Na+:H+ antiporter subunit E
MRCLIYFVLGFIVWILVTWPFAEGMWDTHLIVMGLIVSFLVSLLFHEIFPKEHRLFMSPIRMFWLLLYVPVFFYYVIKANFDVVYRALHPAMPIHPGIVKVKTDLKTDSGITALANSITLTPGTLTVDLTHDGYLYVHWINVTAEDVDAASEKIVRRFEWFIKRIFE